MKFISEKRVARLLSPIKNFGLDEQLVEHRRDPLTRRRSIVLTGRRDYVKRYFQTDEQLLAETAQRTRENCPFCPEKAGESTPKFPAELMSEGTIQVGEARTFPSLFAHSEFNAVTVITNSHYLRPGELVTRILVDTPEASTRYLGIVHQKNHEVKYGAVLMNCLSPVGSTVVHPHMQALASDQAFNMLAEVDEKTRVLESPRLQLLEGPCHGGKNARRALSWIIRRLRLDDGIFSDRLRRGLGNRHQLL